MCFSFLSRSFAIFDQPRSQSFSVSVLQTSFFDFATLRSFGSVGKIYHPRVPLTPPSINSVRSKPRSFHSLGSSTRFLVILFLSQLVDAVNEHQLPLWVGAATKIVCWCFGKGTSSAPKTFTFWGLMLILRCVSRGSNGFFYGFLDGTNFEMATNLRFWGRKVDGAPTNSLSNLWVCHRVGFDGKGNGSPPKVSWKNHPVTTRFFEVCITQVTVNGLLLLGTAACHEMGRGASIAWNCVLEGGVIS